MVVVSLLRKEVSFYFKKVRFVYYYICLIVALDKELHINIENEQSMNMYAIC